MGLLMVALEEIYGNLVLRLWCHWLPLIVRPRARLVPLIARPRLLKAVPLAGLGSSLSVRNFLRMGSTFSIQGGNKSKVILQAKASITDYFHIGSSLSVRGHTRVGSACSVLGFVSMGSTVSIRHVCKLGSTFSVGSAGMPFPQVKNCR